MTVCSAINAVTIYRITSWAICHGEYSIQHKGIFLDYKQGVPGKLIMLTVLIHTSSLTNLVLLMLYLGNISYNPTIKCSLAHGLACWVHA
jgi:hypothetical protein